MNEVVQDDMLGIDISNDAVTATSLRNEIARDSLYYSRSVLSKEGALQEKAHSEIKTTAWTKV